jgi:hypothetical protein
MGRLFIYSKTIVHPNQAVLCAIGYGCTVRIQAAIQPRASQCLRKEIFP